MRQVQAFITLFLFLICFGEAQGQSSHWERAYDPLGGSDVGVEIFNLDTGYYLVSNVEVPGMNGPIIKTSILDSSGNELSSRNYFGGRYDAFINNAIRTADGGFALTGSIRDSNEVDPKRKTFLMKIGKTNDTVWTFTYENLSVDNSGVSVCQAPDNGFLICSTFLDPNSNNSNINVLKVDGTGNLLWTKPIGNPNSDDDPKDIQALGNTEFILSGGSTSNLSQPQSQVVRPFILKGDSSGTVDWLRNYGPIDLRSSLPVLLKDHPDSIAFAMGIIDTSDPGQSFLSNRKFHLGRLDTSGNEIWRRSFGTAKTSLDCEEIMKDPQGNYLVAAHNILESPRYEGRFLKVGPDGSAPSIRNYRGRNFPGDNTGYIYDLTTALDTGYIFTGRTYSYSAGGSWDIWVLKTNCDGWDSLPKADFTPHYPGGTQVVFENKSSYSTSFKWYFNNADSTTIRSPSYSFPGNGTYEVTLISGSCGSSDTMVQQIQISGVSIPENKWDNRVRVFPNPASQKVHVEYNGHGKEPEVVVYGATGKIILSSELSNGNGVSTIQVGDLSRGVYFIGVTEEEKKFPPRKLIVR